MRFSSLGVWIGVLGGVADVLFMSDVIRHIGKDVKLGENVQIWNFSYIGNGAVIGDNTKIGSLVHVDYGVKIGENCKVEVRLSIDQVRRRPFLMSTG